MNPIGFPGKGLTVPFLYGLAHGMGVRLREEPLPHGYLGGWNPYTRTVFLHNHLNGRQRRCTLCHELIHAWYNDSPGPYANSEEYRTRKLTARALVNEDTLRKASFMYDDDLWHIAIECDVTEQVLKDRLCLYLKEPLKVTHSELSMSSKIPTA